MAIKTFSQTSGAYNWSTSAADWTGGTLPVAGDSLIIADPSTANTLTLTLDVNSPALAGLTATGENNDISIGANTLNVNYSATSSITLNDAYITVAGGVINVGASGAIDFLNTSTDTIGPWIWGYGTVNGAVVNNSPTSSGPAGELVAKGGVLEIKGAITDASNTLALVLTAATDTIKLDGASAANNLQMTSGGTLEINTSATLMLATAATVGTGTVKLDGAGSTLTDAAGITVSTGTITGQGKIASTISVTGAAHVTESGGALEITGAVTNGSGGAAVLTVGSTASDKLLLDAAGNSVTGATFASATGAGTLEVASGGALTAANAIAVGSNTLKLDGAAGATQVTDANGITLAGGSISGTGTLAANTNVTGYGAVGINISNADKIKASGGVLDLTGAINGPTLQINTTAGSDLKIDGVTSAAPIAISNANQTLEIGAAGKLTLTGAESVTNGAIKLDGGTLVDASGLTLGAGSTLSGFGVVSGSVGGAGSVTASGGTLEFQGAVDASTLTNFNVASGGDLKFDAAVGAGANAPTVTFAGNSGTLDLTSESAIANFDAKIANFQAGDTLKLSGVTGDTVKLNADGHTLDVYNGATLVGTINLVGNYSGASFTLSGGVLTTNASCFTAGTRIRTPDGEAAVETLKRGDLVMTVGGEAKPVSWLGRQTVSMRFADPQRVMPVRVKAGAIADNVPARDLVLSPDHALFVDGVLIEAGALINGGSIVREARAPETFVYYHVELADHSLILAENAPAETFVDNVDRLSFDNWAEHQALYPDGQAIEELRYPRAKSRRQLPTRLRARLAERAATLAAATASAA